jgi:hypothetical protein
MTYAVDVAGLRTLDRYGKKFLIIIVFSIKLLRVLFSKIFYHTSHHITKFTRL